MSGHYKYQDELRYTQEIKMKRMKNAIGFVQISSYAEECPFGSQLEQFVLLVSVSTMWSNFVNMTDGLGILKCLAALTLLRS